MSNRPGYKHTPLGWIPEEWEVKELEEVSEKIMVGIASAATHAYRASGIVLLRNQNIKDGYLDDTDLLFIDEEYETAHKNKRLKQGDLLTARTGYPGATCVVPKKYEGAQSFTTLITRPNQQIIASAYLNYYINSSKGQSFFEANQIGGGQKNVNAGTLSQLPVFIPKYNEQLSISAVLSTWDEAITKTQQLIAQLQQRNKGLTEQLLTGKKRLNGYNKAWREIHLDEAFNERNETGFVTLNLLSVGSLGVYPQSQSEKRDTSNSDKAKYKRICPGDIGYNTMRMWQGRSALSSLEGIVSPAYTIVTPKTQQHSEFYAYLFKLPSVVNKFFRNSQGLVQDTLNCKFKDFAIVKVEVPEYEEQIAIANVLSTAQVEVKSYEQKLNALQQQKKGLMQKLLMGEVRVKFEE